MTCVLIDESDLGLPDTRHRATMVTRVVPGRETVLRIGGRSLAMEDRGAPQTSRGQITRQLSSQTGTTSGTYLGTYLETRLAVRRPCSTHLVVPAVAIPATFVAGDAGEVGAGGMIVEIAEGIGTWTSEIAETHPIEMIAAANATVEIGETEIEIVSAAAAPRLAVDPPLAGIFGMQET